MRGRALAALAGVAVSTVAHADRIAVESYVGDRPADAERVLAPIRPILERHGFVVNSEVLAKRFEAHVWRSGGARAAGPSIHKKIEDGIREFTDAKLSAANTLKTGIDLARANPVAWVNEPKYRDQVRRGLLTFALALNLRAKEARDQASRAKGKRQADYTERATADELARNEAMDDLLLNFPTFVVTRDEFGGAAEGLFAEASKRTRQSGGGSIELDVDDPNVIVYVDEAQQPRKTTIGNVGAGRHRVLVVSASESREYAIDVMPNRRSRVVVKWNLDSVLKLGDWTGFAYTKQSERQREPELLAALIGTSGSIDVAATLTVNADASGVAGQSYDMRSGKPLASCAFVVNRRADSDAAEKFVRCLGGEKDDPRVAVGGGRSQLTPSDSSPASANARPAISAPVADVSSGDEDDEAVDVPATGASRRWMLWTAIGSFGAAAIGGGLTAKFVLDGRAAGDELDRVCANTCTSEQAKAIIADQDTANHRAWIAAGASGVAIVGGAVFLFLWHRSGRSAATPTAQISPNGASLGWAIEF